MQTLSEQEILRLIENSEPFEATLSDGSFRIKVEDYVPVICAAVHDGNRLRTELHGNCMLDQAERYYEEDPYTGEMIDAMPITLVGCDSRYEYDLNRPLSLCVYKHAWGKQVWRRKPGSTHLKHSHDKHRCFYRVLDALISKLQRQFRACVVFDVHSYNHLRRGDQAVTFNLGSEQIDMERWGPVVRQFRKALAAVNLPNVEVSAEIDRVFQGKGYLISHVNSRFENTLVLPTEVAKVYMDELSGEPYPLVINQLKDELKQAISGTAALFARRHTRQHRMNRSDILSSAEDPVLTGVDRELYRIARGVETLQYINPINIRQERKLFLARNGNYQPQFRYRQLKIDPYLFREKLYRLPVEEIRDPGVQQLYRSVIDGFAEKIDLLVSIGSGQFLYNSLRYYGEPSEQDTANARFLLYAPSEAETTEPASIAAEEMVEYFRQTADAWGLECKIETSTRMVAKAMVNNSRRTLLVRKDVKVTQTELEALAHHELGVHMVTTLNAREQPLKVFSLGLPSNTHTQEGLAILSEYLSGNISLERLQTLALRVLAVHEMLRHGDFRRTWLYLHEEHSLDREDAFSLATRVHRGGGFTKDYLYLRGLRDAVHRYQQQDITGLFIGKTGFEYLPIIDELIERDILKRPRFLPGFMQQPRDSTAILNYLISAIR